MQLVDPTDYAILAFLATRGRNNAVNLATGLDYDRSYVNTRLRALATAGYITRVGPAANSGLYEITDAGYTELAAWTTYDSDELDEVDFDELVDRT